MPDFLLGHEASVRLVAFGGMLGALAVWEIVSPWRIPSRSRLARCWTNLALSGSGALLVRLFLPVAAVGTAAWCEAEGFGLFNRFGAPFILSVPLSLLALDLVIYTQHVAFHRIPLLWRLHRVHHADPEIDVTTGVRFHPIEILLSMAVKMTAVATLGIPPIAVLLFEIVLNGMAMFNHANALLPVQAERLLRRAVVTPEMHRVHHSVYKDERDMNFSFNLSIWDRLFRTYLDCPRDGFDGMRIGLDSHGKSDPLEFVWCLALPFLGDLRQSRHEKAP